MMIPDSKRHSMRTWWMVGVSALAVVLVAAVSDSNRNWALIRGLPPDQRSKLLQNLRKFDLELLPEKQEAIRDLDRRITELDPELQGRYFSVLRRYHDWLNGLPENRQNDLLGQSPDERMETIRKLVADYPVPSCETPPFLRIAEVGELSPFELASVFRIWQTLTADQRKRFELMPQERGSRAGVFHKGTKMKKPIPRETKPPDYDEENWVGLLEEYSRKARPAVLFEHMLKKKPDEPARPKIEALRKEVPRRQAINLYLSKTHVDPVQPERLARFVAALPLWAQAAVEHYPPDEARRRVSLAYRLVFPHPREIGEERAPSTSSGKGQGARTSSSGKSGPAPAQRKAVPATRPDAPF
jgi:hypothetical protein